MEAESKVESPATFVALTFTELPEEQDQRPEPAKNLFFTGSLLPSVSQCKWVSKEKLGKNNWSN